MVTVASSSVMLPMSAEAEAMVTVKSSLSSYTLSSMRSTVISCVSANGGMLNAVVVSAV